MIRYLSMLGVLAALALGAPFAAVAQSDGAVSIAIIDMQRVLRESVAVQQLQRNIDALRQSYQAEIQEQEEELRNADRELAREQARLSPDNFGKKRRALEQKVARVQRAIGRRRKGLEAMFNQGMKEVRGALVEIVRAIASERQVDLVITKATVVLTKPKLEITSEALERLNRVLPKVAATVQPE